MSVRVLLTLASMSWPEVTVRDAYMTAPPFVAGDLENSTVNAVMHTVASTYICKCRRCQSMNDVSFDVGDVSENATNIVKWKKKTVTIVFAYGGRKKLV